MEKLRSRLHAWTLFFMAGLVLSGLTARPVPTLYRFGMIACAFVPVWAFLFGPLRGIPLWWRLVDASFGVVGFLPMWLCDRWARRLESAGAVAGPGR